jgi:hypothetical protein
VDKSDVEKQDGLSDPHNGDKEQDSNPRKNFGLQPIIFPTSVLASTTMRLHVPSPFSLSRWSPSQGCNVDGLWVPGEVSGCSLQIWWVHFEHMDPDLFHCIDVDLCIIMRLNALTGEFQFQRPVQVRPGTMVGS